MINEAVIQSLIEVTDELEKIALSESRTSLWRLHLAVQQATKYLKGLNGEINEDEPSAA